MAIAWDPDAFGSGDDDIDAQHRGLFARIDNLLEAIAERRGEAEIGRMLDFLESYCGYHFGFEERLMAQRKCPGCRRNELEHRAFMRDLAELKERFRDGGGTTALLIDIEKRVSDWLFHHICRVDRPNLRQSGTPQP